MSDRPVLLYAAVHDEIAAAEAGYQAVFDQSTIVGAGAGRWVAAAGEGATSGAR